MNRRSLILCGGLLEGAVTQVALSFLLEGYDVVVCADQVVCGDPEREAVYLDRIRYCAGHIVTTRQIILELLSQEKDEAARPPWAQPWGRWSSGRIAEERLSEQRQHRVHQRQFLRA